MSYDSEPRSPFRGTTICAVKRDGVTAIAGDGQVTMGESVVFKNSDGQVTMGEHTIMKGTAKKIRRIYNDRVVIGFAGTVSDAFALAEKLEDRLTQYSGNLPRAAIELAQDWRMDKAVRRLEAMLICADRDNLLLVSGTGEVIEPDEGILTIGSGGNFALAAARALYAHTEMSAREIAESALRVASEICVYTNSNIIVETV